MEAVRRYVFPVVWMVIFGLIAAALVRLAFFGDGSTGDPEGGATPTAQVDQYATVAVERGDIASVLTLPATVQADPASPMKATAGGEVTVLHVKNGDHVEQGDKVLEVRAPAEPTADPAGADAAVPAAPAEATYHYTTLRAGAAGTVTGLDVVKGQTVAVGDVVASISPGTHAVVASLTPEQQLQLMDQDLHASTTVPTSPDPVACEAPRIQEKSASADGATPPADQAAPDQSGPDQSGPGQSGTGQSGTDQAAPDQTVPDQADPNASGSDSSAALRCPVPAGTRIVPGLSLKVTVDLGSATGVLVLPTTAVEGEVSTGNVYVLDTPGGEPVAKPVTLGKRGDGKVEITGGLAEGDEVLQFVPGVENTDADESGGAW